MLYGPARARTPSELGVVVRRFSATATWAVGLIVASGVFQAWRQIGSWKALTDTDYGTILLLKVTLVMAAIEAGLVQPALGGSAWWRPPRSRRRAPSRGGHRRAPKGRRSHRLRAPGHTGPWARPVATGRGPTDASLSALAGLRGGARYRDRGAYGRPDRRRPAPG